MAVPFDVEKMKRLGVIHPSCLLRETPFGPVAVLWSTRGGRPEILRILLSSPEVSAERRVKYLFPHSLFSSCSEVDFIADKIAAFLNGKDVQLSLELAAWNICAPFQRKVLLAEHEIHRGRVSTYQRIAGYLGTPRGARAVGTALAHNPFPILIPCHRTLRSDGTTGGFQGGSKMKRALLEMEGIRFDGGGRVAEEERFIFQET